MRLPYPVDRSRGGGGTTQRPSSYPRSKACPTPPSRWRGGRSNALVRLIWAAQPLLLPSMHSRLVRAYTSCVGGLVGGAVPCLARV